ncbi:TetR/AcrR family transcriptional regulator [Mycobacteroides abscessus]|uniref:TetR/AcrR family transcriptional regulator n=1 Tax=Mycobacteroides abscessus TaxID=36809 RepID=UPI0009260E66|nr:TetR/AcrR family transcriptional regulator [Mycobacteroides abscessus]SHQ88537.1 Putative transcriptional regulator, TetR family [Mycobacteroides abscessus subsp. bolletii]SHR74447.1 Putative transcriptional regulator, TetR family [Mycobacteroides abscessus subsp. bolletii]SHT17761.1 Putative transcriptional regulator, TetR family [Mycobacteroides abscessus subsp. bolletii]SKG04189.1 Putative transcriptional regulator, TetR family [Mycobacteroides abscessus subsp. bolletii]SKG71823.1 Putati
MALSSVLGGALGGKLLAGDAERDRLLDAARAEFAAHGFRRASVADIARRARVSKPTLFRRCGAKEDIMVSVIYREVIQFGLATRQALESIGSLDERLAEAFAAGMRECRTNPIVKALRAYDNEVFRAKLMDDYRGEYQFIRTFLAVEMWGDSIPLGAAECAVEVILRLTASLLVTPTPMLPTDTDEQTRAIAQTFFPPIIAAAQNYYVEQRGDA